MLYEVITLYCKLLRSTVPHGRIRSIDVSAAAAMPGVFAVYTGEDIRTVIPNPYYGPAFHDQPILALGKVHYVGEPVAAVLASDPHVAEQAMQLIVADYEELPAVFRITSYNVCYTKLLRECPAHCACRLSTHRRIADHQPR